MGDGLPDHGAQAEMVGMGERGSQCRAHNDLIRCNSASARQQDVECTSKDENSAE